MALQLKLLAEFFERCLAKVPIPRKELDELDYDDQLGNFKQQKLISSVFDYTLILYIEYPLKYLEDDSIIDATWQYLSKVPEKELTDFLTFLLENWVDSLGTSIPRTRPDISFYTCTLLTLRCAASGQKNVGKTSKSSMIGTSFLKV